MKLLLLNPNTRTDITKGEVIPLDVHIMLDTSGSLLVPTGLGTNNWTAIKDALDGWPARSCRVD